MRILIIVNITGGLGVFAGYTQQAFIIDLPISEYHLPTDIFVENNECAAPCTIKFTTDGGSKLNYNWDFGDGNSSSETNPAHQYSSPGTYEVTLSLSEGPGNLSIYSEMVTIK